MGKKRCIWSGRRGSGLKEITVESTDRFGRVVERTFHVLPEHEEEFIAFNRYLVRYVRPFLWSVVNLTVAIVVLPLAALLMGAGERLVLTVVAVGVVLLGLLMVVFPFSTPETVRWLGLRRARMVTRVMGFVTMGLGAAIRFLI